jgi:hypothetical protein
VALVHERTIPTERQPFVGEVSANFCGQSHVKLYYDRRSVGQSVLVPSTHLGPATNFVSFLA